MDQQLPLPTTAVLSILYQIQALYLNQWKSIRDQIKGNLYNTMVYRFLENPKRQPLSPSYMLFDNYFNALSTADGETYYGCNNGWTMGGNKDPMNQSVCPTIDIEDPAYHSQYSDEYIYSHGKPLVIDNVYTRHELIVWGDCVKLRYTLPPLKNPTYAVPDPLPVKKPKNNKRNKKNKKRSMSMPVVDLPPSSDSSLPKPFFPGTSKGPSPIQSLFQSFLHDQQTHYNDYDLFTYMTQYIQLNAALFDGFRIDNAHNTDIQILSYFIDVARQVNPNIIIVSELFTNDRQRDKEYVDTIGINLLIRESIQSYQPSEMTSILYKCGGDDYGTFHDFLAVYIHYDCLFFRMITHPLLISLWFSMT